MGIPLFGGQLELKKYDLIQTLISYDYATALNRAGCFYKSTPQNRYGYAQVGDIQR